MSIALLSLSSWCRIAYGAHQEPISPEADPEVIPAARSVQLHFERIAAYLNMAK